jgi:hypothetical protein
MRLFTDHDKLLSMVIFYEKSLYIHMTSLFVSAMYRQHGGLHGPPTNPSQVSSTTRTTAPTCGTRAAMPVSFQKSLLIFSYAITNRVCGPERSKCSTADAIPI